MPGCGIRSAGFLGTEIVEEVPEKPAMFARDVAKPALGFSVVSACSNGEGARFAPNIHRQRDSEVRGFVRLVLELLRERCDLGLFRRLF